MSFINTLSLHICQFLYEAIIIILQIFHFMFCKNTLLYRLHCNLLISILIQFLHLLKIHNVKAVSGFNKCPRL